MLDQTNLQKIQDIVKESLPAALAEELRNELNEIVQLRKWKENAEQSIQKLDAEVHNKNSKINELNAALDKHKQLDARESEISSREKKLEITILTERLNNANSNIGLIGGFVDKLVRNVEVRKEVFGQVPIAVSGGSNGCGFVSNGTQNITEETKTA